MLLNVALRLRLPKMLAAMAASLARVEVLSARSLKAQRWREVTGTERRGGLGGCEGDCARLLLR